MPRYYRKVIRIRAEDSPNVQLGLEEKARGLSPSGREIVPGVLSYDLFLKRRETWDEVRQCIGLDGMFYKGAQVLLYPPTWITRAEEIHRELRRRGVTRKAKAIGIDPAEGGDKTSMAAVDELGLIELVSRKTPNTNDIIGEAIAFGRKHGVDPEDWMFDRGGGGKQHADRLRAQGYSVRTVGFGEQVVLLPRRGLRMIEERIENLEERYQYVNRRAQMYHELRLKLDPANEAGFALPSDGVIYAELRRQMAPIPLTYSEEGRIKLLAKNKKNPDSKEKTLTELIGNSPDELDSVVIAVYCMEFESASYEVGGSLV